MSDSRTLRRPAGWISLVVALTLLVPAAGSAQNTSSNANLSDLTVSPTDIRDFASATTSYTVGVANPVESVTVTATRDHSAATITIGGTTVQSGTGHEVDLTVGSNTISVVVTAEDTTTTKTYTITVNRCAAAGFCYKAVNDFPKATLYPNTSSNKFPRGGWSDGETLYVLDSGDRKVHAYDFSTGDRQFSHDFALSRSGRTQYRGIWSDDGEILWVTDINDDEIEAYKFSSRLRQASDDIDVGREGSQDLWSNSETIYVSTTVNRVTRILAFDRSTRNAKPEKNIIPAADVGLNDGSGIWSDGVTIWVYDNADKKMYAFDLATGARDSSKDSPTIEQAMSGSGMWSDGETLWLVDGGHDGVLSYVMPVSDNHDLRTITVDEFETVVSDYDEDEYSIGVPSTATQVTVGAEARQLLAEVSISSPDDADDSTDGHQVNLSGDSTEVTITVTAQDDDTMEYTVTIEKGLPAEPTITMLTPGARTIDVTWSAPSDTGRGDITGYDIRYETGGAATVVSPAWSSGPLTYQLTGLLINSEYRVQVRAVNEVGAGPWSSAMTASTVASTDATLSALTVSPVDIEGFDSADTEYLVRLANSVSQVTIRPETNHAGASVRVAGTTVSSGTDHTVAVPVGRKRVSVVVTAEDTSTTKTYVVLVDRGSVAPGGWNVEKDLLDVSIDRALSSDGDTLWGLNLSPKQLDAFNLATGDEQNGKDIGLSGVSFPSGGAVAHMGTVWVVNDTSDTDRLLAYDLTTKQRKASSDISLPPGAWKGAATDGETIWVVKTQGVNANGDDLRAYAIGTRQPVRSRDLDIRDNTKPAGAWSDGVTIWVANGITRTLQAFDIGEDPSYDSAKNISLANINLNPWGIWSDGVTMWVGDHIDGRVYSYNMRPSNNTDVRIRVDNTLIRANPRVTSHLRYVDSDVEQVTLEVVPRQISATVEISPEDADGSTEGHQVDLALGENTVTFVVTAQDETTTDYTLVIDRVTNATLTPSPDDPDVEPASTAVYDIKFQGNWDGNSLSSGSVPSSAHFSQLIGAVHSDAVTFLEAGEMASAGVESMAEIGGTTTLKTEINTAINATTPTALRVLEGSGSQVSPKGSATLSSQTLTTDFPRVTLLTMIAPSPDWFVGISGLSLLDSQGAWLESHTVKLFPWDAGTEDGSSFSLTNPDTSPQGNITSLRGEGRFNRRHLATLTFTRRSVNISGSVSLSSSTPRVDTELTATLSDPDVPVSGQTWEWERSTDKSSWTTISGATSASYTPVAADVGNYLRVTATYTDVHDSGQKAVAVSSDKVLEAPNQAPSFSPDSVSRSVEENTAAGENIGAAVSATDPDAGDSLTYTLGGADASSFDIVASSGQLQTKAALDYEGAKRSYSVTVTATDDDGATATATVTISVTDVNEAPSFSPDSVSRSVEENTAAGENIGAAVSATDPDAGDSLTYTLGGADASSFDIVASSGQLQTKAALDYEGTQRSYSVTVTATDDDGATGTATVTVSVTDVDEVGSVSLSSSAPRVFAVLTASLSDPDGSVTGVSWTWQRKKEMETAWGDIVGATSASYAPVVGDLTYFLRATVSYRDVHGGKSASVVSANAVVANRAPVFSPTAVSRSVNENVSGAPVGDPVTASDDDTLTYSLTGGDTSSFSIDSTTGQLTTAEKLDHEDDDSYSVTVTATDRGNLTAVATVSVSVVDVDEDGSVSLSSTTPQVDTALTASLSDPDDSVTVSTWAWARKRDTDPSWTPISGATSASYTPVTADVGHFLRVSVTYTDTHGSKTVQVVSANAVVEAANRPPVFNPVAVSRNVDENTAAGMNIGAAVAATDADGDSLTYRLGGTDASSFAIVASSGQLRTRAALDYEGTQRSYSVTVTATDGDGANATATVTISVDNVEEAGSVSLSSSAPRVFAVLTASVSDPDGSVTGVGWTWQRKRDTDTSWSPINGATSASYAPVAADLDHFLRATASYTDGEGANKSAQGASSNKVVANRAPVFSSSSVSRSVDENLVAGALVGDPVTASDDDTLSYSLTGGDTSSFLIDSTTGQLTTAEEFNYETKSSYSVMVTATDRGNLTAVATVTVSVINRDDPGVVSLSSSAPRVFAVLTASLSDPDGSVTGVSWTWQRKKEMETAWGDIVGATSASYAPVVGDLTYFLRATVSYRDVHGGKSASVVSANAVVANRAPVFSPTAVSRSVNENVSGAPVGDPVTASDDDTLTYSLTGGDTSSFSIDSTTGQLTTAEKLDHEDDDSYSVTVTATDRGNLTAVATVSVSVVDVDEDGSVSLSSTTPQVDTALTASLSDPDDSVTVSTWAWARKRDTDPSWTPISGATSASYTPVTADVGHFLRVSVTYTDTHGSKTVQVVSANAVVEAANRPPVFNPVAVSRNVDENTAAGMNIGAAVAATDADGDSLTYRLGGTDASSFAIVASSGQLRTRAALDYEGTQRSYSVTVTATDGDGANATATVTISVDNVEEAGSVSLSSSAPRVFAVLTASVSDPDGSVTGVGWTWQRKRDTDTSWSAISGATSASYAPVAADLDHFLRATASYTDAHGANKSASVVSSNKVVANRAPVFSSSSVSRSVDENLVAGALVGDPVTASDDDTLSYSLSGGDTSSFLIDSTTGQLTTAEEFNYETKSSYSVMVTATDRGNLTAVATVTVSVNNRDDPGMVSLSSSTPRVYAVLTALVSDPDGSVTGQSWTWQRTMNPSDSSTWEDISGATSASYTPVVGDSTYYLQATVSYRDGEGGGKSASGSSTSAVANNRDPVFDSSSVSRSVNENLVAGALVGDPVTASDDDTLTYSLTGGDTSSFSINSTTGQLTTAEKLNHEDDDSYSVMVTATDRGNLTAEATVNITVTDVDEDGTVSLSSTTPQVGTPLTATLSDPDDSVTGQTWAWARSTNQSSWTAITAATSASYTPVTADLNNYLRVTVTYTDTHDSGQMAVVVSANAVRAAPVTNQPPSFGTAPISLEVREDVARGTVVGTVTATDPDGDSLTYTLEGPDASSFEINPTTGQLTTAEKLDYETKTSYSVTVKATDPSTENASKEVTISVIDVETVLTLSSTQPRVGTTLSATVTDPGQGVVGWQWARSTELTGGWVDIGGATAGSYLVTTEDVGNYLQVTVTYTTGDSSNPTATLSTATSQRVVQPVSTPPPSSPPSGSPPSGSPSSGPPPEEGDGPVDGGGQTARSSDIYLDVEPDTWYEPAVTWMVERGITQGCGSSAFCPGREVTRQEFVTFLWRAAGKPPGSFSGTEAFSDVQGGYADQAIGWAASIGVTSGCTSGEFGDEDWGFCPENPISRAEIATLLFRFVEAAWPEEVSFDDVPAESYYRAAVGWMSYFQITSGCQSGMFCPHRLASRAEVATLIYRVAIRPHSWGAGNSSFLALGG